jgi:phosphatidylserine/phosphatidylglycerophosphate/cardiolipin synthase-like enzyme
MSQPKTFHHFGVRFILLVPALAALGWGFSHRETISASVPPTPSILPAPGAAELWFSRPQEFDGRTEGGPDGVLVRAIDAAACCVDAAVYDIDLLSVARAMLRAVSRGVTVRIVTDSDNANNEAIGLLRGEGIPVVGDEREALMHDKFVVIDRRELWAGSMNLTTNDAYRNDNNFLHLHSPKLAEIFSAEFEEMFTGKFFGVGSPRGATAAPVDTAVGSVQALFAPEDGVARHVIELIRGARKSIHFLAFSFTSAPITDAMLERFADGVAVAGVIETTQAKSNSGAQWNALRLGGAAVYLDANPRNMHHKVIVIDGEIVITGSYNFSESAESKNDEDLLIIWNAGWAGVFEKEFQRIYDLAVRNPSLL